MGTIAYPIQWRWVSQGPPVVLKHRILLVKRHLKAQNTFIKNAFQGYMMLKALSIACTAI